jgi:hypothetical protein
MKSIIRLLIISCIICLISAACEKEEYNPYSIIGKWDWLKTEGSLVTNYPSENNRKIAEYTKDSIYRLYVNGELSLESRFRTFDNNKIAFEEENYTYPYDYIIRNDSLILWGRYLVSFNYYRRIK